MRKLFINAIVAACVLASIIGRLPGSTAASFPSDEKAFAHVLNRVAFGPRRDDMARLRQIGLQRYIEEQLHPERIADESVNGRLAVLATIGLSEDEIVARYEIPQLQARRERRREAAQGSPQEQENPRPNMPPEMMRRANQLVVELSEQKLLRAIYSERQLQEVLTDFWFNHFNVDARKGRGSLHADHLRARRDSAACTGQVSRFARGHREESGHALLPGQLDERGPERSTSERSGARLAHGSDVGGSRPVSPWRGWR